MNVQVAVQKTAEELKRQQERETEERAKYIASRVPQLSVDGLDKGILCLITYVFISCFQTLILKVRMLCLWKTNFSLNEVLRSTVTSRLIAQPKINSFTHLTTGRRACLACSKTRCWRFEISIIRIIYNVCQPSKALMLFQALLTIARCPSRLHCLTHSFRRPNACRRQQYEFCVTVRDLLRKLIASLPLMPAIIKSGSSWLQMKNRAQSSNANTWKMKFSTANLRVLQAHSPVWRWVS